MEFKFLCIIFVLILETVNSRQLESLKNDSLNTVFEPTVSAEKKPLIVTPKHLNRNSETDVEHSKVSKTPQNVHETQSLRDEIKTAVNNNVYVVASSAKNNTPIVTPKHLNRNSESDLEDSKVIKTSKNIGEAKSLRDEIKDAVNNNVFVVASSAKNDTPIVTPKHLNRSSENDVEHSKVIKTTKNADEAKSLRDEIKDAVNNNVYVVASKANNTKLPESSKNPEKMNISSKYNADADESQILSELDKLLDTKDKMESLYSSLDGLDEMGDYINDSEEDLESELKANVVESYYGKLRQDDSYSTYRSAGFIPSKKNSREILKLTFIEEYSANHSSSYNNINEWKTIKANDGLLLIGFTNESILIKRENSQDFSEIDFNNSIRAVDTFVRWSSTLGKTEGIILVSLNTTVHWIYPENQNEFWTWHVGKNITAIRYFKIKHKEYLAMVLDKSNSNGSTTINIYEFNFGAKEFTIIHENQLDYSSSEIIFLNTGRDIVFGVAQLNYALLFTYSTRDSNYIRFEHITRIESDDISSIAGFNMGGQSYIAIGGLSPQILRYDSGHFIPQTILDENFGLVEYFLPIPVQTYRDDLLLLVQHKINFDTHTLSVVEVLIWNGISFFVSEPVPCKISKVTFDFGVHCLLDPDRKNGIYGAGILETGKNISLIVPRYKASSSVFKIHTKFQENVENLEIQKLFDYFKKMELEQEILIDNITSFLNDSANINLNANYFYTPELNSSADINEIYINNDVWTQMDSEVDYEELFLSLKELENTLTLRTKRDSDSDTVEVDNFEIDDLTTSQINGHILNENLFYNEDELNFTGTILFDNNLVVTENLIKSAEAEPRLLESEILETDAVTIDGNLKFLKINGIVWDNFLQNILMSIFPNKIEKLQVEGDIFLEKGLNIESLNNLTFPDEYLISSGQGNSIVTALKLFRKNLSANAIDTAIGSGTINDVDPFNFITLSENQKIAGLSTFYHMDVTELLEVNGSISSHDSRAYFSNPNLLSSNIIQSACDFKNLFVNGEVYVVENFNNYNASRIFGDIIYEHDNEISIVAPKSFANGYFEELLVHADSLNEIKLNDFVSKESGIIQELDITNIMGNVYINYLMLNEYNSKNISKSIESLILLNEENDHNSNLIFKQPISSSDLIIHQHLNSKSVDNFRDTYNDFDISDAVFNALAVKNLNTTCNITGLSFVNGISMKDLKQKENFESSQIIYDDIDVDKLIIYDGIKVRTVNDVPYNHMMVLLDKFYDIPHMVVSGAISVEKALITGNVNVQLLNLYNFDNLLSDVIWLNRPNWFQNKVKFFESIKLEKNLLIDGHLNKIDINRVLLSVIYKNGPESIVTGLKNFSKPILLQNDVKINNINNIPYDKIATKNSPLNLNKLNLLGDLIAEKMFIQNKFNDFNCTNLNHVGKYDDSKSFIVGNVVRFKSRDIKIKNLQIDDELNGFKSLKQLFENLIFKTRPITVKGGITFLNLTSLKNGIFVENLNELKNVPEILSNLVFRNAPEPLTVDGSIIFKDFVETKDITILNNVRATKIKDFNLKVLLENTIKIDGNATIKKLNFLPGSVDGNDWEVMLCNDHSVNHLITLNTVQNLTGYVKMAKVYLKNSIDYGQINGEPNFKKTADNTLMQNGNQLITAPTSVKSLKVLNNLNIKNFVDRKNISNCATLNSFIEIQSPISINKVISKNLETNDYISGLDFNNWYEQALWESARKSSEITGDWIINNLTTDGPIFGKKVVNDKKIDELANQLDAEHYEPYIRPYKNDFSLLCEKTNSLITHIHQRINFIKYFKLFFKHTESAPINKITFFDINKNNYILVNIYCFSKIYHLNYLDEELIEIVKFKTGLIKDIISIPTNDSQNVNLIVTTAHHDECIFEGIHIWDFNMKTVKYLGEHENSRSYSTVHKTMSNDNFYAINEEQYHVAEMRINSSQQKIWNLPKNIKNSYRFLPNDLEFTNDVALANGEHLVILTPNAHATNDEITSSIHLNRTIFQNNTIISIINDFQKLFANIKVNLKNITSIKCNETNNSNFHNKTSPSKIFNSNDHAGSEILNNSSEVLTLISIENILDTVNLINSKYFHLKKMENTELQKNESYLQKFEECLKEINLNLSNLKLIKNSGNGTYEKSASNDYIKNLQEIDKHYRELNGLKQNISKIVNDSITLNFNNSKVNEIVKTLNLMKSLNNYTLSIENVPKLIRHLKTATYNISKLLQNIKNSSDQNISDYKQRPEYEMLINGIVMFNKKYSEITDYLNNFFENETNNINNFIKNINCCYCKGLAEIDLSKFMKPMNLVSLPLIDNRNESVGTSFSNDLFVTDNPYLPSKYSGGEILGLKIGTGKNKPLIAIINPKDNNSKKDLNYGIKLYFDVMQGDLFQSLSAYNPRNLTAIYVEQETFLSFVENDYIIKIMAYRGVEGFIEFATFRTEKYIKSLHSISLLAKNKLCKDHYLVAVMENEIDFYEIISSGHCISDIKVNCFV